MATSSPVVPRRLSLTARRQAFVDAYLGAAARNATRAAELVGFKHPRVAGSLLKRKLSEVIEDREITLREEASMSAKEVVEGLSEIAREKSHKDRKAALDTLAKIHGLLTDKLDIKLDRRSLAGELEGTLKQLTAGTVELRPEDVKVVD